MAKELPYFRFNPDEYLTGDITFEDFETQGVFILICCYYWKSDCNITMQKLCKRIPNAEQMLNNLIESKIIKHFASTDEIHINFLHKQFQPLISISTQRSNAANARWSKYRDTMQMHSKSKAKAHANKDKDKDKDKDNKKDRVDWVAFGNFFNKHRKDLPEVNTNLLSKSKKAEHIKARIKQYGKDVVMEVILRAERSNFLNGRNESGQIKPEAWVASLDWLMLPENFEKVLDGKYNTKKDHEEFKHWAMTKLRKKQLENGDTEQTPETTETDNEGNVEIGHSESAMGKGTD